MDPQSLIDPALPPMPAPWWFVHFFKVLGFALHMVPMNLWYAGILLAMILYVGRSEHGRRMGARLIKQMPVLVALGINFGIVPLLFIQVAYYKFFYPATILMAWFWLAIIALLIPAYYGVYVYVSGLRNGEAAMTPLKRAAGWVSALFFVVIGFLFANGFSLMAEVDRWGPLWQQHSQAGAALGTALNVGDPSLWPRWLLMFGLALGTTAAWMVVDAAWLARRETEEYRRWANSLALKVYLVGAVWFAVAGSWYTFGTWPDVVGDTMLRGPAIVLTILTAVAPGLPLLLLFLWRDKELTPAAAALIGLAQFGVLGINAVSRQVVQHVSIGRYLDFEKVPIEVQYSPMVVFLLLFVFGAAVIGWMIAQVLKASPDLATR